MTGAQQPTSKSPFEMIEEAVVLSSGVAVAAPMLPGFLLTVPMLISVAVVAALPLVIAGLVAAVVMLAVAILAVPVLLVRSIGRRLPRVRRPHTARPPRRRRAHLATDM